VLVFRNLAVVTPGGGNCIVALDKDSGKTVWKSTGLNEQAGYGSCIGFTHEKVPMVANLTSRGMVGVSALTGAFLWRNNRVANTTAVCTSPVYCDGYVFGASGYGNGGACVKLSVTGNGVTAAQVWETKDMDCHHGGYVVVDGYIYGNNGGGWSCLELKTGRKVWSGGGVGKGSICYADGMLYTYSENGGRIGLAEATPKALSLASQFSVAGSGQSWAHPVVIGGRLYLRYDDNLYAFDVRGPDYAATADEKSGVKSTDDSAAKATPPPSPARPRPAAPAKPVDDEERTRRLWNMAENFLRNNLQALARSKLEEIVNKYPDTEHAEMARERLRNLR